MQITNTRNGFPSRTTGKENWFQGFRAMDPVRVSDWPSKKAKKNEGEEKEYKKEEAAKIEEEGKEHKKELEEKCDEKEQYEDEEETVGEEEEEDDSDEDDDFKNMSEELKNEIIRYRTTLLEVGVRNCLKNYNQFTS